ncbi:MAG: DUF4404 family protein [bacterium]|nr:DUF4404 family protein [bacterium]
MPERIEHLKKTLTELRTELAQLGANDELDEDARLKLETARAEIAEMLNADPLPEDIESEGAMEQLIAAEREFEASHPTLAGMIQRVIHALGQMGI